MNDYTSQLNINKFFIDLFTGKDNYTWDLGRIMWCIGTFVYFAISLYSLYLGNPIDLLNWATGFGAILAGGGGMIFLKNSGEPNIKPDEQKILEEESIK